MGGHKHSKNGGYHFGYHEKVKANKAGMGTSTQRLGTDSQLPFGYCSLSLQPAVEPVVTPSGHIYSRESILEYLLVKTQELKRQNAEYESAKSKTERLERAKEEAARAAAVNEFVRKEESAASSSSLSSLSGSKRKSTDDSQAKKPAVADADDATADLAATPTNASTSTATALALIPAGTAPTSSSGASKKQQTSSSPSSSSSSSSSSAASSTASAAESDALRKKHKLIDETPREAQIEGLRSVCPWIPQFTPEAPDTAPAPAARRPSSPCTGQPLRAKDLIPIRLEREGGSSSSSGASSRSSVDNNGSTVRFVCPVSRDTIIAQPMVLIKPTGAVMSEETARSLAYPTMRCPITSRKFTMTDVLPLARTSTGFASTGNVEAKKYRPSIN